MNKRMESVKGMLKQMIEQCNPNPTIKNTNFVNDLNVSDSVETFLAKAGTSRGLVDSGAPKNVSRRHYVEEYMVEYGISEDDVVRT